MQVAGPENTVTEIDLVPEPPSETNPYLNCFKPVETVLQTETQAVRVADQSKARSWKISNPSQINSISGEHFAHALNDDHASPAVCHALILVNVRVLECI